VRSIHEQLGLGWTGETEAAVAELDREARSGAAAPSHSYDLADYGLAEREVAAAFDR
jgi:hypothetical protein